MGMFNYVFWDYRLNGPTPEQLVLEKAFQTKDMFGCNLDVYYMSEDAKLYKVLWEDLPNGTYAEHECPLEWLREHYKEFGQIKASGAMRFYTTLRNGKWVEYAAGFEDGILCFCFLVRYGDKYFYEIAEE